MKTKMKTKMKTTNVKTPLLGRGWGRLFLLLAIIGLSNANAQVGIGTTTPDASAALEIQATDKGLLPPRMTTAQRDAIANPAEGLVIFNTDANCLQWFNDIGWFDGCNGSTFVEPVEGIEGNATCATATISVTPCSAVSGATINDDQSTADGIEYDWTDAPSHMSGGTTRALVEIGGQCWFRRNTFRAPTAPCAAAINTGCNTWLATTPPDNGYWGYYNTTTTNGTAGWRTTEPAAGEGLLYQWSAAMNGSTTERAQGVCPTGWHVPSDCEWMYLENTLGMSTSDQDTTGWRNSGSVGTKLSTLTSSGTNNSSGFTALFAGFRGADGAFNDRGSNVHWWSSSEASATNAQRRGLGSSQAGVHRFSSFKAIGFSVRCIKD